MKDNKRIATSFDDLIFEGRNRDYGAYQLRRRYKSVVISGTVLASLAAIITVLLPYLFTPSSDKILSGGSRYVQVTMENLEPPREELYVPPAPPPPEEEKIFESVKYVPPVVIDSIPPVELKLASVEEIFASTSESNTDSPVSGSGDNILAGLGGAGSDEPFSMVEIMPTFRGGDLNTFRGWVKRRTNYPKEAIDRGIKGKVFLTFIIEPDGSVSNVTVVQGVHPLIDSEAVKAIEASPAWSPGLQRGQPVRVRFSMNLNFTSN
jgi:protein TonB